MYTTINYTHVHIFTLPSYMEVKYCHQQRPLNLF